MNEASKVLFLTIPQMMLILDLYFEKHFLRKQGNSPGHLSLFKLYDMGKLSIKYNYKFILSYGYLIEIK